MRYYKTSICLTNQELLALLFGQQSPLQCGQHQMPNGIAIQNIVPDPLKGTVTVVLVALERDFGPLKLFECSAGQEAPRYDLRSFGRE
jgi:hypothetical protein